MLSVDAYSDSSIYNKSKAGLSIRDVSRVSCSSPARRRTQLFSRLTLSVEIFLPSLRLAGGAMTIPATRLSRVVFPDPEGPMIATKAYERCSLAASCDAFAGAVTDDHEKINQIAVRVAKNHGPVSPRLIPWL